MNAAASLTASRGSGRSAHAQSRRHRSPWTATLPQSSRAPRSQSAKLVDHDNGARAPSLSTRADAPDACAVAIRAAMRAAVMGLDAAVRRSSPVPGRPVSQSSGVSICGSGPPLLKHGAANWRRGKRCGQTADPLRRSPLDEAIPDHGTSLLRIRDRQECTNSRGTRGSSGAFETQGPTARFFRYPGATPRHGLTNVREGPAGFPAFAGSPSPRVGYTR